MWIRFSGWLYRISNNWVALVGVVVFLLFTALVLPGQSARDDDPIGDAGSPDLSFYYSGDDLYRMAEDYGEQGRAEYIRVRFTFDLVWPLVYTFFLATTISWVFVRAFSEGSKWRLANLMPVMGMLFDYLENMATSLVMWRYPAQTPLVVWLAGVFTGLKWILIGGSFILLLVGAGLAIWKWIKRGRSVSNN
jgi:hypothetical protein